MTKKVRSGVKVVTGQEQKEDGAALCVRTNILHNIACLVPCLSTTVSVTPPSPSNGFQGQDGRPLTGVSVSPFVLLYDIDGALGMPLSSDYEAVHDNTFLWLYTVMLREFGDQMKNLLTDDTSNMYELNQPIAIEYVSVVLFDQSDPNIPSKEDLDVLVREAFTGENLVTYLNGIQSLPRSNPFR